MLVKRKTLKLNLSLGVTYFIDTDDDLLDVSGQILQRSPVARVAIVTAS